MRRLLSLILLIHPFTCFAGSHANWKLLNPEGCGTSNSDRIVGGTDASIGSYPWLARVGYATKYSSSMTPHYECGGAVINKFYIITAAHCSVELPQKLKPVRVRLGEHNTKTNPDCDHSFCNDPHKEYDVDEVIAHENWNSVTFKNDIALLRVKTEIEFTEFVRPICVIKGRLLEKDFVGQIAEVAGWGLINSYTGVKSTILQTLKIPIRSIAVCQRNANFRQYLLDSRQMCAGGIKGQDSCSGDSGGPLMKVEIGVEPGSPRYFIIGLVSFGLRYCGNTDTPGVYTDLSKYVPWILDHLRA